MPQVPFNGVQQVAPQNDATPRYTADVHPEAFGTNIAQAHAHVGQAVAHLGQTLDTVGGEIFARGLAMQDLYNHSQAQEASSKFMMAAGDIHENLRSMQGKDAVDYYADGYKTDLEKSRASIREGLDSPMAQKLYDSESRGFMARTIFSGATLAGTANKNYAMSTADGRISAISNKILSNPNDDPTNDLLTAEDNVRAKGQLQGHAPEAIDEEWAQTKSGLLTQRIKGLARLQPFESGKMLEEGIKNGSIRGKDIADMMNLVQQQRNTVGARIVSNQVMNGAGNRYGAGIIDIRQAQYAVKQIESGGNYETIGVQTKHGRALGAYGVMEEFLPDYLARAGMKPMTAAAFLKDRGVQDEVFRANFTQYMQQTGSANDAASMWLTGKPLATAGSAKDAMGTDAKKYVAMFNSQLAKNAPMEKQVELGTTIAKEMAPDDVLFPDYVQQRIRTDHSNRVAMEKDSIWNARTPIEETLVKGMQDGKLPSTLDELRSDPKVSAAWDKLGELDPSRQRYYLNILARNAGGADADYAPSDEMLREKHRLQGMAQSQPAEFLDTDVVGLKMPRSWREQLWTMQQQIKKSATEDPRLSHAMQVLGPTLQAAGILPKDKDDYNAFKGALMDQLADFSAREKRPAKYEEIKEMGNNLILEQATGRSRFLGIGTEKLPMYKFPVPSEVTEAAKKLNPALTDRQIEESFLRLKYQELYGDKPKSTAKPNVPALQ